MNIHQAPRSPQAPSSFEARRARAEIARGRLSGSRAALGPVLSRLTVGS